MSLSTDASATHLGHVRSSALTSLFGAAITYAARSRLCEFYNSLLVDVFGFLRFQARLPISELCLLSKTHSLGSGDALGLSVRRFSCSK